MIEQPACQVTTPCFYAIFKNGYAGHSPYREAGDRGDSPFAESIKPGQTWLSARLKLHGDIRAMGCIDLPEATRHKVKGAGNQHIGELFDADIVEIDRIVEKLPTVGNLVLQFGDAGTGR